VTIKVEVAKDGEKPEWNLQGQTLSLSVDLKDSIASLKERLKEAIGLPVNKQKLKCEALGFLPKDQQTLASLNVLEGAAFSLGLKSRGGKRQKQ